MFMVSANYARVRVRGAGAEAGRGGGQSKSKSDGFFFLNYYYFSRTPLLLAVCQIYRLLFNTVQKCLD